MKKGCSQDAFDTSLLIRYEAAGPLFVDDVTLDLAYQDDAEDVPKTERSWRALIDRVLDPAIGEYMSCTTGVVGIAFPDPSSPSKVVAWHQHADRQLALLDVERFAVTQAVSRRYPICRRRRTCGGSGPDAVDARRGGAKMLMRRLSRSVRPRVPRLTASVERRVNWPKTRGSACAISGIRGAAGESCTST